VEANNTQLLFFQHIKSILPPHISFVDEVAGLLKISNDSAYRRIRGEKPISLDEMQVLANQYKISIDQFLHIQSDSFIFSGSLAKPAEGVFEKWLENVLRQLTLISSFKEKHLYYLAKDLPITQQFMSVELLMFKSFLWRRSILHYSNMKDEKFSFTRAIPQHIELGKKIEDVYLTIPTTEIWNLESINSTIRQIEFYRETNMFESEEDVKKLYQSLLRLINHLEHQAEVGKKFKIDGSPSENATPYNLFWNDLVLGDNTVFAKMDGRKVTILNHSVINFITTTDERFNENMNDTIANLVRRSAQISIAGEKERYRFFNRIRDKIKLAARL
jgi:hypothetical protein